MSEVLLNIIVTTICYLGKHCECTLVLDLIIIYLCGTFELMVVLRFFRCISITWRLNSSKLKGVDRSLSNINIFEAKTITSL